MSQPNQTGDRFTVALCTREFPPGVYGGADVHVECLAKELSKHVDLTVHCQAPTGRPRWRTGHGTG